MPSYNAAATLTESIGSVLAQEFDDWELLVVDDASTDGGGAVAAAAAAGDARIRVIALPAQVGAAEARNVGIRAAAGRYIAFLDADDIWFAKKLRRQVDFMQRDGIALSYTGFIRRMRGGASRPVKVPPRVDHGTLLGGNIIGCLTAMYDSAQVGRMEMPRLRMRHDYALWLNILKLVPYAHGITEPLAEHRERAGSLSANRFSAIAMTWRLYREQERLSPLRAGLCLGRFLSRRMFN